MPFNSKKVIIGYSAPRLGVWLHEYKGFEGMAIAEPIGLFISFTFDSSDAIKRANLVGYLKEVIAVLVFEGTIKNTQQIAEIGIEKKLGSKSEVNIFLQKT